MMVYNFFSKLFTEIIVDHFEYRSRSILTWITSTGIKYVICNVHLDGHPDKHKERLAQLMSVRKQV